MEYQKIIEETEEALKEAVEVFKSELIKIRSGRISPGLIEDMKVDCFGAIMPIKQLGSISFQTPHELLIQLWDRTYTDPVVKAIENSNLEFGIRVDGKDVYLTQPSLSEDSRKNLIQVLNKEKEKIFQELRRIRDKAWREIQMGFQNGEIREDDKYKGKDKLDELSRDYREKIDKLVGAKQKEILS